MKLINTRILGIAGMIGAPWIFLDFIQNGLYDRFKMTTQSGIFNFIFITGWTCSVLALYKLNAMGNTKSAKVIMNIQLVVLFLANCWNIFEIFSPDSTSMLFQALSVAWPVAGFFMLITGVVIVIAKRLQGWKRYVPLLAGLWFPFMMFFYILNVHALSTLILSGLYATVVFTLLGFSIVSSTYETATSRKYRNPA
jgi:hypothetical protein